MFQCQWVGVSFGAADGAQGRATTRMLACDLSAKATAALVKIGEAAVGCSISGYSFATFAVGVP